MSSAAELAAPPVGLIAGGGRTPFMVARGIRQAGRRLVVLGLRGYASPRLADLADEFHWSGMLRPGSWVRRLRSAGVRDAVMIGSVRKREVYSALFFMQVLRYIPDLTALRLWFSTREDRRDNAMLVAVADELRRKGIEMASCVKFCQDQLADEGQMTRTPPPGGADSDVEFGWRIARASADLDIGQALAVKDRDIIAVEAIEGTDSMIRRAGRLCRIGGWTLVKVARPRQDMRFDVPTIGPNTIRNLADAKCACVVLEAGKTFIVDKPTTLELADKLHISIVGKKA